MSEAVVAIVGGGPVGTYALERLSAHALDERVAWRGRVVVIDAHGRHGGGDVHHGGQAPTSYMNRTASQISFAADESNADAGPLLPPELRPTFLDWCAERLRCALT